MKGSRSVWHQPQGRSGDIFSGKSRIRPGKAGYCNFGIVCIPFFLESPRYRGRESVAGEDIPRLLVRELFRIYCTHATYFSEGSSESRMRRAGLKNPSE